MYKLYIVNSSSCDTNERLMISFYANYMTRQKNIKTRIRSCSLASNSPLTNTHKAFHRETQ